MRSAPALAAAVVVLFTSFDASAASAGSLAAARDGLVKARASLASALKAIEQDPPSTADLDAALAAVGTLKDAIDAGAMWEPDDLGYAKAVLAARKELRTQRDYVEARRAKVHIFEKRRTLDAALAALGEKVKRLEAKDAAAKDFEDARAAAEALRKAVAEAGELAKQDEKFAGYLAETEASVARQAKAIDDRATRQQVDRQRGLLEEGRRALATATGSLAKGASDAQFEAADKAAKDLARLLEDAKALEDKDRTYRADADKARAELAQAKKKADDLWSETGVQRLKAELEPAHKDLQAAGKGVRAKSATEDQLAEARTAAIVVRKLLEKFQPQAQRSQALAGYLNEVKKTLGEVESELQRRSLDQPMRAVSAAVRKVEGKGPTDEHFQAADEALSALEKVLQPIEKPDPSIAALVGDARALLGSATATVSRRRVEVSLGAPVSVATKALWKVEAKGAVEADFDAATTALDALEKVLEKVGKPEASVAAQVNEAKVLLKLGRGTVAKRRAEVDLESARKAVAQALRPIEGKAPTEEHFAEASTALTILEKTVEAEQANKDAAAALADARGSLRDARATVSKRRVEVSLGAPVTTATKLLWKVDAKSATHADFDAAEAALVVVEKVLETIKAPPASVEAKVNEAKVLIKVGRQSLAKRRVEVSLGEPVQVATRLLWKVDAKSPLPTDVDFEAAEKAVSAVEKLVEPLQKPDPSVAAKVNEAKVLVKVGRATLAKRRAEVGVISAQKAVAQALRPLERKAPTDEQFAEANTALTVLEKTLEAAQGTKDAAATVADGRATLRDAKATVRRRRVEVSLEGPKAAVLKALATVEGKAPTEEHFKAAHDALAALDKTIKEIGKPEKAVAPQVSDAIVVLRTAGKTVEKRRLELDVEAQRAKVEDARKAAAPLIAQLQRLGKVEVQEAESSLKKIVEALDAGAALTQRDRPYAVYDVEVRKRLVEMNEKIAMRKLAISGSDGASLLRDLLAAAKARIQTTRQATSTEADLEAAVKAVDALKQALEERAELEYQDRVYGDQAGKTKDEMGALRKDLEFAMQGRELRKRTVEALAAGRAAADAAAAAKDMRAKKLQFDKAIALLQSCESGGASMLAENKPLGVVAVLLDGSPSTPKDVVAACAREAKETEQAAKQVEGLIGFEDGPRKAYEAARALLKEGKKKEALAQFKECIPSGMILQHRNPELKDRKLEVGGGSMTLAELIAQCTKQRDALEK